MGEKITAHERSYLAKCVELDQANARIDELTRKLEIAKEALNFYAAAKILFISKDVNMAKAFDDGAGLCMGRFESSEVHIKDDGGQARAALKQIASVDNE